MSVEMKYKDMDNLSERVRALREQLENSETEVSSDCCDYPGSVGGWDNFGQFADYG